MLKEVGTNLFYSTHHWQFETCLTALAVSQAIALAGEYPARWQRHLNAISGMIFLGTPHIKINNETTKQRLYNILRVSGKPSLKKDVSDQAVNALDLSAAQFARTVNLTHSDVKVISGFETHATKLVNSARRWSGSSVVVSYPLRNAYTHSHNHGSLSISPLPRLV